MMNHQPFLPACYVFELLRFSKCNSPVVVWLKLFVPNAELHYGRIDGKKQAWYRVMDVRFHDFVMQEQCQLDLGSMHSDADHPVEKK